ncbi:MAG: DUF2288 domain-containing protein [Cyanobacteria bacterium J06598_3]
MAEGNPLDNSTLNTPSSTEKTSAELRAELVEMMGPVQWEYLKPHVQRDVVVVVNPDLDLADVGVAIATDNTQAVERWITEQLILKPNAKELSQWSSGNKRFTSLIVQPYVLVQDAGANTGEASSGGASVPTQDT